MDSDTSKLDSDLEKSDSECKTIFEVSYPVYFMHVSLFIHYL